MAEPSLGEAAGPWGREHLETDVVGWLTTSAPDGRLQSSVVSFLWDGETILVYSQPGTPKLRNIEHDPRVSFHLNSDPYGDHVLTIEASAEIDRSVPAWDAHERFRAKYREPLAHWQMDEAQTARDFSVPLVIEIRAPVVR